MPAVPTAPLPTLKIHPREHELIAPTQGRGVWIVEISPLDQLTADVLAASAWLFEPKTAYEYGEPIRASFPAGQRYFRSAGPAYGAETAHRLNTGSPGRPATPEAAEERRRAAAARPGSRAARSRTST